MSTSPSNIPAQAVEAALSALLPDSDIDSLKGGFWWGNVETILGAAAPHMMAAALQLADKWQEDFPYKANELREALGVTND